MAIKKRLSLFSGARVDLPHLRSLESSVSADFDMLLRGMFTGLNKPYLIRGFKVKIPNAAINATNLQIEVADSVLLHSSATESGTVLSVDANAPDETLNAQNAKVIGSFQANAVNYISLDYRRTTDQSTTDQAAGWSPSQALEYQRTAPLGRVLDYRFIINTSGFSTYLPLYIVKTTLTGAVEYITKASDNFFRLGSGGANPNPANNFTWGNYTNSQVGAQPRREWIGAVSGANQLSVAPGANSAAFEYGDFSIHNMKEWMDAMMTRIKEITKSEYWYLDSNSMSEGLNVKDLQWDSIGSVLTGAGNISYNLVLEAALPTEGLFQDFTTDNTILPGDVYVEGFTSGTKATLNSFSAGRLIINSMTKSAFVFDEEVWMRRKWRPSQSLWTTVDYPLNGLRYGSLQLKKPSLTLTNNISSWGFVNITSATGTVAWTECTISTTTPHGLSVGGYIFVDGLKTTGSNAPNGVHRITAVPSTTSIKFITPIPQSGSPIFELGYQWQAYSSPTHPYTPKVKVTDISPGSLTQIKIMAPGHNFSAPVSTSGNYSSGSKIITNLASIEGFKLGQTVYSSNLTTGSAKILRIKHTAPYEIEVSQTASVTATAASVTAKEQVLLSGFGTEELAYNVLNGVHDIEGLSSQDEIIIDLGTAITGTTTVTNATVEEMFHEFTVSMTGALPTEYNVDNSTAFAIAGDKFLFNIGSDFLPTLNPATGAYEFDGLIAKTQLLNPVQVSTINNDGNGNLTVVTTTPHELVNGGPQEFTIFGNPSLSEFIRSYTGININVINSTTFVLQGTGLTSLVPYTNGGTDKTYIRFSDNPYAGPVQWSADMVVKGIMGDLSFTIPQTAIVDTSDEDVSVLANQFNINGITGTAYLQDGDVMFIKLERNKSVSNNTLFTHPGGDQKITTASIMTDESSTPLVAGDFLKFADEDDNKWLKIKSISNTLVELETDHNQPPSLSHRPAKTGKMVYSKGVYSKVYVKQHHLVDSSASTYWIAMRRDNNSNAPKAYFRNLEIEAGEVRQVTDNQTSNILTYTGAMNEGAINPNYSVSIGNDFAFESTLTIGALDVLTCMITFATSPARGFQIGDRLRWWNAGIGQYIYFTVKTPITSRTIIVQQSISDLSAGQSMDYYRDNQFIEDTDNLTAASRKHDRQAGWVHTALSRPVYDESIYIQQINISGSGTVRSGSYVYKGSLSSPTALAWVVHGNAAIVETVESASVTMPGGHSTIGSNAILVHVVFGTFSDGDGLFQNGVSTGRTVNNPGNPSFTAPSIYGDNLGSGVELVLPPNKRTQVANGNGIFAYGIHSFYKQSMDVNFTGEDLLVIVNDGIRTAGVDYEETFGGPKAKIRLKRITPPNTRVRFRVLSAYGSALVSMSGDVSLQAAYNGGQTIQTAAGKPVEISSNDIANGAAGLINRGSILMNGGGSALGGIFNEIGDKNFVIGKEINKPKEVWAGTSAVKTHSSHAGSAKFEKTAAQVVTGAVGTIISGSEVTLSDNYSYRIKVSATARRSDGTFGVTSFSMEGTFYRSGGGAQVAGSPTTTINGADGDGVVYAIAFGLSGNDVVAVVYGNTGATVQWALTIEWQAVGVA